MTRLALLLGPESALTGTVLGGRSSNVHALWREKIRNGPSGRQCEQFGDGELVTGHLHQSDVDDGEVDGVASEIEEIRGGVIDRAIQDLRPECEDFGFHGSAGFDARSACLQGGGECEAKGK